MIVDCNQIRRRKGVLSRERCKLFLKQYTEQDSRGLFVIKPTILEDFGINKLKFDQIFDGPPPQFETSKRLDKPANPKKKAQRQETLAKFLTKNNAVNPTQTPPTAKKIENKVNLLEEMKKREEEFQLRKALKEEEKLILKKKHKEEYMKITAFIREWSKQKEDLLLEDQKVRTNALLFILFLCRVVYLNISYKRFFIFSFIDIGFRNNVIYSISFFFINSNNRL